MKTDALRTTLAIFALAILPMTEALAQAAPGRGRTQVGVLNCDVSRGIGYIVGSTRDLECRFRPVRGRSERYRGTIRHMGLDIGATRRGVMIWGVLAASRLNRDALAGRYVGVSAEATAGLGLGANVLVGGLENSLALQPLSVGAQVGLNVAVGVAEMTLVSVPRRSR